MQGDKFSDKKTQAKQTLRSEEGFAWKKACLVPFPPTPARQPSLREVFPPSAFTNKYSRAFLWHFTNTASEILRTAPCIFRIGFRSQATVGGHSSKFRTVSSSSELEKSLCLNRGRPHGGYQVTAATREELLSDIMSNLLFEKNPTPLNKSPDEIILGLS